MGFKIMWEVWVKYGGCVWVRYGGKVGYGICYFYIFFKNFFVIFFGAKIVSSVKITE